MPYHHCIQRALDAKLLTEDDARTYNDLYDDRLDALKSGMTPAEAASQAARDVFGFIEGEAAERRRQTFLTLAARKDILSRLDGYKNYWTGNADPYLGATALYDRLVPGRGESGFSVEGQYDFWRGHAHARLDQAFDTFGTGPALGRLNVERLGNVIEEVFAVDAGRQPVTTDAAARQLATAWVKVREDLRSAFNRFGGHIGKVEDYGFPQSWNPEKIRTAGAERFADALAPLAIDKTIDRRTGAPFRNIDDLKTLLKTDIYNAIVTDGWATREPSAVGGMALANRRAEHRFLKFNDAKAWFDAAQAFGEADPVNSMLSYVDGMSRDIALMQVMGPNPSSTLNWLEQELTRREALGNAAAKPKVTIGGIMMGRPKGNKTWAVDRLKKMHAVYTHSNQAPAHPVVADVVDDTSNVLTASLLQSAVMAAVPSDMNFTRLTRSFNGLEDTHILRDYARMLNPADGADRKLAIRITGLAQNYAVIMHNQARYIGEINGHRWSRWIADRMLAWTGLTPHTSAMRWAFAMNTYGVMAQEAGKAFADLDEGFANFLKRYRINAPEWDVIRATPAFMAGDTGYIRPGDIYTRTDIDPGIAMDLAGRLADAANTELEFAVPSSSLAARGMALGTDPPGTWPAVARKSLFMFRNFGWTYMLSHGRRFIAAPPRQKASYAASLIILGSLAGALTIQTREVAAGRDPRPMDDYRFWVNALALSGGLGALGDFAYAGLQGDTNTGGLPETIAGPLFGFAYQSSRAVMGNPLDAPSRGSSPLSQNTPTRLLQLTKSYIPGGRVWYLRAAEERLIWDQIQSQIDPGWQARVARTERWYQRNFGNDYWWRRGEVAPDRAPDMESAAGQQ